MSGLFLPTVLVVALVAALTYVMARSGARDRAAAEAAATLGLSFRATAPRDAGDDIRPWRVPRNASLTNLVQGAAGEKDITIGTFRVQGSSLSGPSRNFAPTTVGGTQYKGPRFAVIPATADMQDQLREDLTRMKQVASGVPGLGAKLAGMLIPAPVDFAGLPEFNSSFVVAGAEPDAIQEALSEEIQRFCIAHPDFELESTGSHLVLFKTNAKIPGEAYPALVDSLKSLADAVR